MQGKPLPIHDDGSNVRSYLYCEDVAKAFEVILLANLIPPQIIFVCFKP
jgi:UDP-glucose 4,6-dehydratase